MITRKDQDKRLFERFAARFPAKFKDGRDDFGTVLNLRDASALGAHLTSRERLFLNDMITVEIRVPDEHAPMVLKGEVVWTRSGGSSAWDVGLKFNKLDLIRLARLYKFVVPPFSE